jgi:hypothetical protein
MIKYIPYELGEREIFQCHPCGAYIYGEDIHNNVAYIAILDEVKGSKSLHVQCSDCTAERHK